MKTVMNITTCYEDTNRYRDLEDLRGFYEGFGLDGLEVLEAGSDEKGLILAEDTVGVHLRYFSGWMDLWCGNQKRLLEEFQAPENWRMTYGGDDKTAIIDAYRKNIQFSNTLKPEYLVFHVSECTMAESMWRKYHYTDEQVCDAVIELLNTVIDEIDGQPWLLLENLWYPGLTMEQPEIVRRLLNGIAYPKTGVMLDTGHLMHTNCALKTPDQAVDYIHSILDRYEDLGFIKGVHLHQSLTGNYAKACMERWQQIQGTYQEQMWAVMGHIFNIDTHKPFQSHRIHELLERLTGLEFLCLEQISGSREEHAGYLAEQVQYLNH
ncbi:MAG: TIM barrel protein [Clostridia bacterium]|nr:TIM barrel protein [Clostridia bacterium]